MTLLTTRRRYLLLQNPVTGSPWKRPIKGRLSKRSVRIADPHHGDSSVKVLVDESGQVRRMLGWSDFCLVTDWQYYNQVARHNIDYGQQFYHYCRTFRRLGESAHGGYYGPRSALMPWCISAFWDAVEYGARFDLRWQVSHGYQYRSAQERWDFEIPWAEEGQRRGLSQYLWLVEFDNEWWQNSWLRYDHDLARAEAKRIEAKWREIFTPCPFICMGAPENEGPNLILESVLSDRFCEIHTERDRPAMLKHVFALWWMEGHPGKLVVVDPGGEQRILDGVNYCCGEQTPMAEGPDDFMGTPNPGAQLGQLFMGTMIGAPQTYFDGWDVRDTAPIEVDAPTLESFPMFASAIPEDACTWPPDHGSVADTAYLRARTVEELPKSGPTIYHWRKPQSHECVTVLDELWLYRPPRPWRRWTAYGCSVGLDGVFAPGGTTISAEGPQPQDVLPRGFGGCIIHGELS